MLYKALWHTLPRGFSVAFPSVCRVCVEGCGDLLSVLHYQEVRWYLKKCPIFSSVMSYIPVGYVLYFGAECPIFFSGGGGQWFTPCFVFLHKVMISII